MKMVFDSDELDAIVKLHLIERLRLDPKSIVDIEFQDRDGEIVYIDALEVELVTDDAIPQGPYRTPGTRT